ncbi:unnamed protein product [Dovyalis caffra]|uniref:C3H1-type domain-containing protein n=1 Tax=Dovyalis caffra TaxID=77055 RepID=A0AAV1RDN4_9ROSI|nr:unnamed protein product [Dovyalis caffra]
MPLLTVCTCADWLVKLFLSEDCPSKVGGYVQDHLQKKASWLLPQSSSKESCDLPLDLKAFIVSYNWRVSAGEESQESEAQKLREMRVLEAVYPRLSSVPPSPAVSLEVEGENYADSLTPIIPIIPVEEEEATEMPSALTEPLKTTTTSQSPALPPPSLSSGTLNSSKHNTAALNPPASQKLECGRLPNPVTHLITAAETAVTAIMKSKEQGSLIDTDLLVKILSDPKMIEKLTNGNQAPPVTSRPATSSISPSCAKSAIVSGPSLANGELLYLSSEELTRSKLMSQIASSCPKPAVHMPLMPSNGSLHQRRSEVQSKVTRTSVHQDSTVPAIGSEVASSISMAIPESGKVSAPRPPVGNLFSTLNSVQTTPRTVPTESNTPKISYFKGMNFDLAKSTLVKTPIQPFSVPQAGMKTNSVKDVSYIKNLIKEHGTVKTEMKDRSPFYNGSHYYNHTQNPESTQNLKKRELKPKFQKPCLYFKTPKGCRNGSDCPFQHDLPFQFQTGSAMEPPVAKRMKFSGEITGRT